MQFVAKSKYIRFSPYKLRPIVDVIRGKGVDRALMLLAALPLKKTVPIKKVVKSAAANAKNLKDIEMSSLTIKDIRVDEGPIYKYYKPGAMGRANVQRRRLSHVQVILEIKEKHLQHKGT